MKILPYIFLIGILTACQDSRHPSVQPPGKTQNVLAPFPKDTQIRLYSAFLTLPKGWRFANDDTLDKVATSTARYRFHNRNGKLVYLEYGLATIGNPAEPEVISAVFRRGYIDNNADTSGFLFSDNPCLVEIRKQSRYNFSSTTISGFPATLYRSKRIGVGYTGVYIDSIGQIAGNIADLSYYAEGLDSLESAEVERVIKSLVMEDFK